MKLSLKEADEIRRELWDRDVRAWRKYWVPVFQRFACDLVRDANITSGQMVLDIGTGTGVAAIEAARLAKPTGFVLGIDRSEPMLATAKTCARTRNLANLRFIAMDSERLFFPDGLFDAVTSNCGLPNLGFHHTIAEIFRVLKKNGVFMYNEWRLKNVVAHRIFSEVLEQHRTKHPSRRLAKQRAAYATLERYSARELDLDAQVRELGATGFRKVQVKQRNYQITLNSVEQYLNMRVKRQALKQEFAELSRARQRRFIHALREALQFNRGKRFVFDWKVDFVKAEKP